MSFYRLKDDIHAVNHRHLGNVLRGNVVVDAHHFTSSERYVRENDLRLEAPDGLYFDFCLAAFDVPIVSKRLADQLILVARDDIQLIPVTIENDASYYILNALRQYPCLDESRSLFMKWQTADGRPDRDGQYRMVVELKVSNAMIGQCNICRIDGWYLPLIVSESIRQLFLEDTFSGAVFEPVS